MLPGVDDFVDWALDHAMGAAQEPIRVRRAVARLRSADHGLYCALSKPPVPGAAYRWCDGPARLGPRTFRFIVGSGDRLQSTFEVQDVIETRELRRRTDDGPGPRRQGVAKLQTTSGFLYWAAHPRLLAEGAAILLDHPRSGD